jgi:LPS sulfotransferase NodH
MMRMPQQRSDDAPAVGRQATAFVREPVKATVRFVIVAARRTGSNLLCTLLDSHADVLCHHELFNPSDIFYAVPLRGGAFSLGTLAERAADPLALVARTWDNNLGRRCVGFKMTRGQEPRVLDALLADQTVRVIVLRRANRIKTFVSELRAEASRTWEVYDPAELDPRRARVHVDARALDAYIAQNEAFHAEVDAALARCGKSALGVVYERLLHDDEQRRILAYLGLPVMALSARSVKQNATDLRQLIDNYDALAHELAGTPLADELTDRGL